MLLIHRRIRNADSDAENFELKIVQGFLAAFVYGIGMSLLWEFGLAEVLQYLILLPLVFALFKPVYRIEFLMGFLVGMTFTFGGVLPIFIGTVLLILSFFISKAVTLLKGLFSS